jgi:integral membrane sensor domain MASE1
MRHKIKTNLILKNLLLALTYFIAGKLSLLLAIPPGYASAIWPSCGIAVAAILIFGHKLLPGVLLGSLIINLSLGPSIDSFQALINSLSVPLAIAIGASLQAFFGATLVKKQSKFSMSLDGYQSIFYLYFYGGIIACLVSSLIGGLALTMSNTIPWSNFSITVLTWWVGDTIGVVVFAPIMLLIGNIGDK